MKYIRIIQLIILLLIFSCKKEEAPPPTVIDKGANISEVNFTYDKSHIYTRDTILISTDKFCNAEGVTISIGEHDTEILWVKNEYIAIKTPLIADEQVDIVVQDELTQKVIADDIKVYPGSVAFEYIGEGPFDGRYILRDFNTEANGYIYGGYCYHGTNSEGVSIKNYYDDLWEFDVETETWTELDAMSDIDVNAQEYFWQVGIRRIIGGELYLFETGIYNSPPYDDYLAISKYNNTTDEWDEQLVHTIDSMFYIDFYFQHNNVLYLGFVMTDERIEMWAYDASDNTFSSALNMDELEELPLNLELCLVDWPLIYLYAQHIEIYNDESIELESTTPHIYQYNVEENETREVCLSSFPLSSFFGNAVFSFEGFSIISDGAKETSTFFEYPNRYYKVTPQ